MKKLTDSENPKKSTAAHPVGASYPPITSKEELIREIKTLSDRGHSGIQTVTRRLSNSYPACWPDQDHTIDG